MIKIKIKKLGLRGTTGGDTNKRGRGDESVGTQQE